MRAVFLILLMTISRLSIAQTQDSLMLQCDDFLNGIIQYHPLVKRAAINMDYAAAYLQKARGAFDPKLYGSTSWKNFNDQQYYRQWNAGMKVQLWPGLQLDGGYERNTGVYINPEAKTPDQGLLYLGGSMPLLQGLLIDPQRADLQQARIEQLRSLALQDNAVNDILLDGAESYWEWWLATQQTTLLDQTLMLSFERWQDTKAAYELGDRAAVDTLEAFIQFQNRRLDFIKTDLQRIQKAFMLSNFLWSEDGTPLYLESNIVPMPVEEDSIRSISGSLLLFPVVDSLVSSHPSIRMLEAEMKQQSIDIRLKKDFLKPDLRLKYNWLSSPNNDAVQLSMRNYRWGMSLEFPVLLRKQRAEITLSNLKMLELEIKRDVKTQELRTKQSAHLAALTQLMQNIDLYRSMANNYYRLLDAEKEKFQLGESSVFLINARENSYLQAKMNLLYLEAEFFKTYYKWRWSRGELGFATAE